MLVLIAVKGKLLQEEPLKVIAGSREHELMRTNAGSIASSQNDVSVGLNPTHRVAKGDCFQSTDNIRLEALPSYEEPLCGGDRM